MKSCYCCRQKNGSLERYPWSDLWNVSITFLIWQNNNNNKKKKKTLQVWLKHLSWGNSPELSYGPKCNHKHLHKKDKEGELTQTKENKAWKQKQILEWCDRPWVKECRQPLEAERGKNWFPPHHHPRASGGSMILLAPLFWPSETDFRLLASKTVSEQTSEALCHSVCGHLLQQPQETHTIYARIFSVFSPRQNGKWVNMWSF